MAHNSLNIGRAKTVLVFGEGPDARAVVSAVVARVRSDSQPERLWVTGPVRLHPTTLDHLQQILIPILDRLLLGLGQSCKNYTLSLVNVGAASAQDLGVEITGFSADVPIFLAMLSAALSLPLTATLLTTGHLASTDGDIAMVRALDVKIAAAVAHPEIRGFLYPSLESDRSLEVLAPQERERISKAILSVRDRLTLLPIQDIDQLVRQVFSPSALLLSGLQQGYFFQKPPSSSAGPMDRLVQYFLQQSEQRFWSVLEQKLLTGRIRLARRLITARMQAQKRQKQYPTGLGRRLWTLIQSLPPATRCLKLVQPLLSMYRYLELARLAGPADQEDLKILFRAVFEANSQVPSSVPIPAISSLPLKDSSTLQTLLAEINGQTLAVRLGRGIDAARATYVLEAVTVKTREAFHAILQAFYRHLLRHTRLPSLAEGSPELVGSEALALLERSFAQTGGYSTAWAEAREGTAGGLRRILDQMTEQFKREAYQRHVNYVFKQTLDPLDWSARVALVRTLLEQLAPQLPMEFHACSPEQYAQNYEVLVQAYVDGLDRVINVLRAL